MFGRVRSTLSRWFPFNRVDRICLRFALSILVPFSVLWIFLIALAGTGPVHLAAACLAWAAKVELLIVLPVWLMARLAYSLYQIMSHSLR